MIAYRPPRQPLVPPGGRDLLERDFTATFAADVTLRAAQAALASTDQWLPIDGDPDAPLGLLVETNSTGPLRLGFGAWRDLLLGVQFHNGLGQLITAGGCTVKNVAGYDLTKLMVGQLGVLGTLATLTTRTYRRPEGLLVARFAPDPNLVSRLLTSSLRPQWAALDPAGLTLGYVGDRPTLDFHADRLKAERPLALDAAGPDAIAGARPGFAVDARRPSARAAVPPASLARAVALWPTTHWSADAAFGVIVGPAGRDEDRRGIRAAVESVGGAVRFTDLAPGRPPRFDFPASPAERRILDRLKQAFDPQGKLTPLPWQTR